MSAITLEQGALRAITDPAMGCSLLAFSVRRQGHWLPVMPDVHLGLSDLACASFAMVPYSNRIENGHFTFGGREYQLEEAESHAIHGDVRRRPWVVEERSLSRLVATFDSSGHDDVNWPWPFAVRAEIEVGPTGLRQALALRNGGDTPMPAGFGWHPYFNRELSPADEEARLCFRATGAFPDAHDNRIPSGPPQPLAAHQDFTAERPLERANFLDTCLVGYDGGGYIHWPGSGVRLDFACTQACTHLILYNPPDTPHFAVEPVTNANNGVNLLAAGEPAAGTRVLEPHQEMEAEFTLTVTGA